MGIPALRRNFACIYNIEKHTLWPASQARSAPEVLCPPFLELGQQGRGRPAYLSASLVLAGRPVYGLTGLSTWASAAVTDAICCLMYSLFQCPASLSPTDRERTDTAIFSTELARQ